MVTTRLLNLNILDGIFELMRLIAYLKRQLELVHVEYEGNQPFFSGYSCKNLANLE